MRIAGRAMPVLEADVHDDGNDASMGPLAHKPFGLMLEALDDLKPGEIYIATGASLEYALWGELMSTRAMHLKASGAILDGYIRDANQIEELGFTVFCRGLIEIFRQVFFMFLRRFFHCFQKTLSPFQQIRIFLRKFQVHLNSQHACLYDLIAVIYRHKTCFIKQPFPGAP